MSLSRKNAFNHSESRRRETIPTALSLAFCHFRSTRSSGEEEDPEEDAIISLEEISFFLEEKRRKRTRR